MTWQGEYRLEWEKRTTEALIELRKKYPTLNWRDVYDKKPSWIQ